MKKSSPKAEIKGIVTIFCIGVFLFLGYMLFTTTNKKNEKKVQEIREQYPFIHRKEEVGGYVFSNEEVYLLNHTNLIILGNGKRFRLTKSGYNNNYSPSSVQDFIQTGDSIYKPPYTDSLYVFRNKKQYFFILQNIVN